MQVFREELYGPRHARLCHGWFNAKCRLNKSSRKTTCIFVNTFIQVFREEMYGPRHVWLLPGWFSAKWWLKKDNETDCSEEELSRAVKGYIATDILTLSASEEQTISGLVNHWSLIMFNP